MSQPAIRAACYARVSTDRQAQARTIRSQIEAVRERMHHDGLSLDPILNFTDDGYSGETLDRPALERLRDQVAAGTIDRVYVHSPDRLARRYAYQVLLLDEFRRAGVEVVFLNHAVDPTPEGELLLQVQGVIAEYERAKILERSRRGKRQSARLGQVSVFGQAPYGYRYVDKQTGGGAARFEVVAEQAAVVGRAFAWFTRDRLSIAEIARRLTAEGTPTARGKKHWCGSAIWNVLGNPAYAGRAVYGRRKAVPRRPRTKALWAKPGRKAHAIEHTPASDWVYVPVPALVEPDTYTAAQEQLEGNRRRSRTGSNGPRHLLQGLTVCRQCGRALVYFMSGGLKCRKSGGPYFYYRCTGLDSHRWGGEKVCSSRMVRADALERAVWTDVCAVLTDPTRMEREFARRATEVPEEGATSPIRAHANQLRQNISRLIDAYQDGLIEKTEFEPRLRQARERLEALERQEAEVRERDAVRQQCQRLLGEFRQFASAVRGKLADADGPTRIQIVRLLIKHIEVDREEVRIVYQISPERLVPTDEPGNLQDHSRREGAFVPPPWRQRKQAFAAIT